MSVKSAEAELSHGVIVFRKYKNLLGELTRKNVKLKYRSSWQMSITNTANDEYGVLYFAAELAEEAGTLKLKGIDLS